MRTICEQARERLSLRLDDELSAHETRLLERHLGRCSACAGFASAVRASTELLRVAPLEPAPPFLLWRRPAAAMRLLTARVAAVTAAAAAALLVAVSTVSLQGGPGQASARFDFWPTGGAIHPRGDGALGVRHIASEHQSPDGPRRGVIAT